MTAIEEPGPRRRRRRRRGGGRGPTDEAPLRVEVAGPEWQWRTFPVFFASVVFLLAGLFIGEVRGLREVVFFLSLALLGYGLAHILTRALIARRQR